MLAPRFRGPRWAPRRSASSEALAVAQPPALSRARASLKICEKPQLTPRHLCRCRKALRGQMINPLPTEIVAWDFFRDIGEQFSRAREKPDALDPTRRRVLLAGSRSWFRPECRAGRPALLLASRKSPRRKRRCRCADREARLAPVPGPCSLSYPAPPRRRYLLRSGSARLSRWTSSPPASRAFWAACPAWGRNNGDAGSTSPTSRRARRRR